MSFHSLKIIPYRRTNSAISSCLYTIEMLRAFGYRISFLTNNSTYFSDIATIHCLNFCIRQFKINTIYRIHRIYKCHKIYCDIIFDLQIQIAIQHSNGIVHSAMIKRIITFTERSFAINIHQGISID